MGQLVYLGLCLLGCLILGSSSTPVEGPQTKVEMPLSGKSEESKENKIPAAAPAVNGPQVKVEMPLPGKSEESKENKIPAAAPAAPAVNGPQAKVEMPPPGKSEESKENKIPAAPAVNVANRSQVLPRSTCSPGAFQFNDNCYEYFHGSVSWITAELQCQSLRYGSHLVSFSNSREEKTVSAFIRNRSPATNQVWIGLNAVQQYNRLVWKWSDGYPYSSGSPLWDNRTPSTSIYSLDCMLLYNIRYPAYSARWLQENCDLSYPYVCKYPAWI